MSIVVSSSLVSPPSIVPWSDFYSYVMPDLPGIQTPLVDFWLRQITTEFFQETCVYTAEVTPIDVVAGTASYDLVSPEAETEPVLVKAVWYDDRPLDIASIDTLDKVSQYWGGVSGSQPLCYTHRQPDKLILYPTPDTSLLAGLRVNIALRPTTVSTGIANWIFTRYVREIAAGVKGTLMAIPAKPWTSVEGAVFHFGVYKAALAKARGDANRSFTRAVLSVQPRPAV